GSCGSGTTPPGRGSSHPVERFGVKSDDKNAPIHVAGCQEAQPSPDRGNSATPRDRRSCTLECRHSLATASQLRSNSTASQGFSPASHGFSTASQGFSTASQ